MNAEQAKAWLRCLGENDLEVGSAWLKTHCPLAPWRHSRGEDRNPSFGIRVEHGDSFTHCFSCNWSGRQSELLILMRGLAGKGHALDIRQALKFLSDAEDGVENLALEWADPTEERRDIIFPEDWLATFDRAWSPSGWVHPYLVRRGMPLSVAKALDMREVVGERRVAFPVRNWERRLVGLHGRAIDAGVEPTYRMFTYLGEKNPMAWLGEAWVDPSRPVVLVESVFDLARVYQAYRNVMCALTASIAARKVDRLRRLEHVIAFFDPDVAGERARRQVVSALRGDLVVEAVVSPDDRDPGDLSVYEVADVLGSVVDLDELLL